MPDKETEGLKKRLVQLTRDLVMIRSTDRDPEERERCFDFILNHLESLESIELQRYESNGYTSLVALPEGVERPQILLCGHIDVIDHPQERIYRSTVKEDRLWGPGTGDMKGAVAILLELFTEFHQSNGEVSLGLALTSDEEQGGENGVRYLFEDLGLRCDLAIIPDGGSLNRVTIEEKGILHLRAKAKGRAGHAARPWLAHNALQHLSDQLTRLGQHFSGLPRRNPGGCQRA